MEIVKFCGNREILSKENIQAGVLHLHTIKPIDSEKNNEILITIDAKKFTQQDYNMIEKLSEIIQDSGEEGHMKYEIFTFHINSLNTYEKDLIKV